VNDFIGDTARAIVDAVLKLRGDTVSLSKPFRRVAHWQGELDSIDVLSKAIVPTTPTALVAFKGTDVKSNPDEQSVDAAGFVEAVAVSSFIVFVATSDTRAPGDAVKAVTPASVGAYACASAVANALNNLRIANTYQDQPLRVVGVEPYLVQPGVVYVLAVTVTAAHVLDDAALTEPFDGDATEFTDTDTIIKRVGLYDDGTDVITPDVRVELDVMKE